MSQHTNFLPIQYRRHQVLWFVLLLLGVGSAVSDATEPAASRPYWTGRIEQDTTWRDTVYVGGDVTIAATATLTLAPNTQVLFLSYRDDARGGLDSTRAELVVEGRLAAQAGGIVFGSADAGSWGADWYGLVVEQGGRADVSHAAIRDGLRCVYAKRGGFVRMDAVAFANCGKPTAPEDIAKPATPKGTERKEELRLSHQRETKITPPMNQPFEIQEITIHIRAEHKAVISALLAAVDAGTPVTGIAELDSLAATYGLMEIYYKGSRSSVGIYRKGSRSSGFYKYRFRLAFSPGANVVTIAGAYGSLPYIQLIEPEPPLKARVLKSDGQENRPDRAITRIPKKMGVGALTMFVTTSILAKTIFKPEDNYTEGDALYSKEDEALIVSFLYGGLPFGYPLGVYLADPVESSCWMTFVGGYGLALGGWATVGGYEQLGGVVVFGAPIMASELSRLLPKRFRNPNPFKWLFGKFRRPSPHVSFGLVPGPQRGLSARATLRF